MWTTVSLSWSVFRTCESSTESSSLGGGSSELLRVLHVDSFQSTDLYKGSLFLLWPSGYPYWTGEEATVAAFFILGFFPPCEYPENHAIYECLGLLLMEQMGTLRPREGHAWKICYIHIKSVGFLGSRI